MYEQVEKPKENKNRAIAKSVGQKKSIGKPGIGFVDNRPDAVAQRKLQDMVISSSQVKQAAQLHAKVDNNSTQQMQPFQLAGIEKGKWVSDGEIHHKKLSDEFYPTYGFVTHVEDNGYIEPANGRRKIIAPAWLTLWNEYDQLWSAASQTHNYANANRTMYSADHEWESFAVDTPLHNKRLEIIAAGGFLTTGQQRPGPIPIVDHPEEVLVDNFVARALAAYAAWMAGVKTKQNRGPKDPQGLTNLGSNILKGRALPQHWTFHPSNSGTWAMHRSGNANTPEDPDSPNGRMTFIYHV
ncbi:MAG: hypothetical protein R8G66_11570 [Cytophagales bacterium]|nr:hypothetical protein [Cytophagales bacterium]